MVYIALCLGTVKIGVEEWDISAYTKEMTI